MKPLTTVLLPPLSLFYSIATRVRLSLFEKGVIRVSRLNVPVISVGNITTGGTGKTPIVEWVCRTLAAAGQKVCILTRGYGRPIPASRVVVSDGTKIFADQTRAGDEPFMLAEKLLGLTAVICDPDRFAAGQWAIEELGTRVFVLDDGFQHLRLFRNLNIVTIDATNPWGGGKLLPYGRLREPLSGLRRADSVVITRADHVASVEPLRSTIEAISERPLIVTSSMRTTGLRFLSGEISTTVAGNIAKPLGAFCGIGNSAAFFSHLKREGYEPILERVFPDHHVYTREDVDSITAQARKEGVKMLFTTAKDAVKLHSFKFDIPTVVLEIEPIFDNEVALRTLVLNAAKVRLEP